MDKNICAFVEMDNKDATLQLTYLLDKIEFPEGVQLAINNLNDAESGVRRPRKGEKIVEISLAHCYNLEDVVRELLYLLAKGKS